MRALGSVVIRFLKFRAQEKGKRPMKEEAPSSQNVLAAGNFATGLQLLQYVLISIHPLSRNPFLGFRLMFSYFRNSYDCVLFRVYLNKQFI